MLMPPKIMKILKLKMKFNNKFYKMKSFKIFNKMKKIVIKDFRRINNKQKMGKRYLY